MMVWANLLLLLITAAANNTDDGALLAGGVVAPCQAHSRLAQLRLHTHGAELGAAALAGEPLLVTFEPCDILVTYQISAGHAMIR